MRTRHMYMYYSGSIFQATLGKKNLMHYSSQFHLQVAKHTLRKRETDDVSQKEELEWNHQPVSLRSVVT